jgi:4-amino-4-deoxy-L-arabinose transferase-like glycosyltransferase
MVVSRSGDGAARAFAALTVFLILIAFLPWAAWLGAARPDEVTAYADTVWDWIRWLAIVVPFAVLLAYLGGRRVDALLERWLSRIADVSDRVFACTLGALFAAVALVLSGVLFSRNPHLVDSIAQLFQARIFGEGSLTAPAPEEMEFFGASHLVQHNGRWFSQYPPGHPALLTLGLFSGVPWIVNPLFAAGTLLLVYAIGCRLLGAGSAKLAGVLYLFSPFVLFMSASYMNHVTTGFFLALALYAALRTAHGGGGVGWPLTVGLALGAAAMIRPLESAAWAAVLGLWMLMRRGWQPAFIAGGACLVGVAALLTYNGLTTGHPLRFGYTLLWGPGHGLGFHTDPWGEPFTPVKSFANTALDLQRLNVFLFGWPFPSLIFVFVALVLAAADRRWRESSGTLAALLLAAPIAYFFYWHRDNYLGPRFLYPSLIPVLLLTVIGIAGLDMRLDRWRSAFRLTLLAGLLTGVALNLPRSAGVVAGRMPGMKLHPEVEAKRLGVSEAVVLVKVGWGNRLMACLWGWGVSASEAERTYRVVDGCRLQGALDEADSLASAGRDSAEVRHALIRRLREWRDMQLPVIQDVLPDPTVRVDTTAAFPQRCYQQVQWDRTGFTLYGTLVWRNDPWLRDGIIYARDLGPRRNGRLMMRYPDRDYYVYAPLSAAAGARPVLRRLGYRAMPSRVPRGSGSREAEDGGG